MNNNKNDDKIVSIENKWDNLTNILNKFTISTINNKERNKREFTWIIKEINKINGKIILNKNSNFLSKSQQLNSFYNSNNIETKIPNPHTYHIIYYFY